MEHLEVGTKVKSTTAVVMVVGAPVLDLMESRK